MQGIVGWAWVEVILQKSAVDWSPWLAARRAVSNALRLACWPEDCAARRALSNSFRRPIVPLLLQRFVVSLTLSCLSSYFCQLDLSCTWIHTHAYCEGRTTYILTYWHYRQYSWFTALGRARSGSHQLIQKYACEMADGMSTEECWISATERCERKPYNFLTCYHCQSFQEEMLQRWDVP